MSDCLQIDLSGRVAIVTGATGQLGRVMARTLAQCGASVAVHYQQNEAKAREIVQELAGLGCRALAVQADVTRAEDVQRMRGTVESALGTADIIVNNAVSQSPWKSVLEQSVEAYESQFRSNVLHNVLMAQVFVPPMMQQGKGRVIAINTECAMQNFPTPVRVCVGQAGHGRCPARACQRSGWSPITVNQVAPGWTISDRDREQGTEENEEYAKAVPLRRRGTDQEIANVVAFLASDLASYITGAYVPVCGGNVMPAI